MRRFLLPAVLLAAATPSPAADPKPVEPFNGRDLTGWKLRGDEKKSQWTATWVRVNDQKPTELTAGVVTSPEPEPKALANLKAGGVDIYTERKFGDCTVEAEFLIPKGSNSGIYLMGEYEVQLLDSFGKEKVGPGDLGGIYGTAAPRVNAAKRPGEWQKIVIEFQAPKFHADKKVANAKFIKVELNGTVIHENVEVPKPTGGALAATETPTGPLMFQGDHGPVAFRNVRVNPTGK